jgi:hypothetical protein
VRQDGERSAHGTGEEGGRRMSGLRLSCATGPAGGAGRRFAPGLVAQVGGAGLHQVVVEAARAPSG